MSDLPPPGSPSPGDAQPLRPPQQSAPLPPPAAPGTPGDARPGIGQRPSGGAPQFGSPPPPPGGPMVPLQSGGSKKPWWKGPAGIIVGLAAVAAIVVGIVLVTSGDDTKSKPTDTVERTAQPDTRPSRTDNADTTSPRRTTTAPDTAPDTGGTGPLFTLPDLTNPPTSVAVSTTSVTGATTTSPTTSAASVPATTATTAATAPGGALAIGAQAAVKNGTDAVQVVVLDAVDNAPATEFLPPDAGDKLVAVKFRFVNNGTTVLGVTPTFDTTLIDASNQQFDAGINSTTLGPGINFARLVPGDERVGWVTFSIPTASSAARVQWKLNFSDNGAEWDLTLPRQDPPASAGVVTPPAALNAPVTVNSSDDQPISVTALKVVDNATPTFGGTAGDVRYVGVQMSFANTGTTKFSDSPEFDVYVIDSDGQQYDAFIFGTDAGPGFDGQVDLAPGDSRTGFISFEIPTAATPSKVQIVFSGGTATSVGEIALG